MSMNVQVKTGMATHTGLRDSHHIHALKHSWDGVGLHGSWIGVAALLNVLKHDWVEAGVGELANSQTRSLWFGKQPELYLHRE